MNKKIVGAMAVVGVIVGGTVIGKKILLGPFKYAGTVEATRVDLPARVATVVDKILVSEGESVRRGQVLAKLSCEDLHLQHELARENFDRSVNLKRAGAISKENFDLAKNKMQEADIRQSWCEIISPVDGTVLTRFLEPSEWVNPGVKVLTVANLEQLWAYFYVSQDVMSHLKVGTEVIGEVPEIQQTFSGTIVKVNDEAEFTPKNVQTQSERTRLIFGVKVLFKNIEGILKPGMTIQSTLDLTAK